MKQRLALFSLERCEGIAEDEADGGEEVGLAASIAAYDYVVFRGEGLGDRLVLVAFEGQ